MGAEVMTPGGIFLAFFYDEFLFTNLLFKSNLSCICEECVALSFAIRPVLVPIASTPEGTAFEKPCYRERIEWDAFKIEKQKKPKLAKSFILT